MSQSAIIINVSNEEQVHQNGLSGTYTVNGKAANEEFALLVVYPSPEIQDIGDQRKTIHWLKADPLARAIVGMDSDATAHTPGSRGGKLKWGLLLCEARPDMPKELVAAYEEELIFLNENPPDYKMKKDNKSGAIVQVDVSPADIQERKRELSANAQKLKKRFEAECRRLVQKSEIQAAKTAMQIEDQRLVAEGDAIWAGPAIAHANLNEIHKRACIRMGQNRPWCYTPQQLVSCPGCGAGIKEDILTCPQCSGWLDQGIEELRALKPKERAQFMYPERYALPEEAKSGKGARA